MKNKIQSQNERKISENEKDSTNILKFNSPKLDYKFDNLNFDTLENINKSTDNDIYIKNNYINNNFLKKELVKNKENNISYQNTTDNNTSFKMNKLQKPNKKLYYNNLAGYNMTTVNDNTYSNLEHNDKTHSAIYNGIANSTNNKNRKKSNVELFLEMNSITSHYNAQKIINNSTRNKSVYKLLRKSVENKRFNINQAAIANEKEYIKNYIKKKIKVYINY